MHLPGNQLRPLVWHHHFLTWWIRRSQFEPFSSLPPRSQSLKRMNLLMCTEGLRQWTSSRKYWTVPLIGAVQNYLLIFVSLAGMATCCFSSLQEPPPPRGTWWTPLARTHLHRSRPPPPPPRPRPRPRPSRARCQRLRSRRTRSTSIWPSRTARSTGTKTLSCERQTCHKPPH